MKVAESSNLLAKVSPMSKLEITSFLSTPLNAENVNSARFEVCTCCLMTRAARLICVARFVQPREKVKCQMELLAFVLGGKIFFIIWAHLPFLNIQVNTPESCLDMQSLLIFPSLQSTPKRLLTRLVSSVVELLLVSVPRLERPKSKKARLAPFSALDV